MGRTILCNECKSTFDEDILKKKNSENECPVCGASLLGGNSNHEESPGFGEDVELREYDSFDEDKIDFWWYEIDEPSVDRKNRGIIYTTCAKCGAHSSAPYLVARTGNYVLIDSRYHATCSKCGNEMKNHILSKRPEDWVDPRQREMWVKDYLHMPKCPTCSSTNIKKIPTMSKVGSVAMWGILSRKVHKQWHCNTCGSEW